ncbi:hypothetical protein OO009_08135 [Flavobacteriaceae bacterium KMM 6897]|nr:hypothetical protein [Flavobacteriaceae bacterium KMM 6897]
MLLHNESFKNNLKPIVDNNYQIVGLDTFEYSLAKYFFSDVVVNISSTNDDEVCLNIEFQNNLTLSEVICFLNTHTWMYEEDMSVLTNMNPFLRALQALKNQNSTTIDIEEISILLKDTTIVIKKIYFQSIPTQLDNILKKITDHHFMLTKNSKEVPFEMFIPVFEENPLEENGSLENIRMGNNSSINDYFGYWGLYYDSEDDAIIYDLENKSMIYGDLLMLNH